MPETAVIDYKSEVKPTWCPGCGDFGVLRAVYEAFEAKGYETKDLVLVSGIGCSSRIPYFVNSYGFHGVHGRVLPLATGIKLANPRLHVVGMGGDGDGFSIGAGHMPHAIRRNPDITYIIMDNNIYGLTKGQTSPTSAFQFVTKSTPYGNIEDPINPMAFAIVYGATFVAKGFSGKARELTELFIKAIDHKGFSFVDVLSPCPTFNKVDTFKYYAEHLSPVPADHEVKDRVKALELAYRTDRHYVGVYYEEDKLTMEERVKAVQQKVPASTGLEELMARFV
ncbi:MAG TPA: 2-oxoacid:ferredoxin oxidoreductase subunit beta [Candidatus Acidoferrales bacterium]